MLFNSLQFLLFLATAYLLSLSPAWMEKWVDFRSKHDSLIPAGRAGFGDLYSLSYLKKFGKEGWKSAFETDTCGKPQNIDLYVINDSYVENKIGVGAFCGVRKLKQVHWDAPPDNIQIDLQKTNILLIETVERYCRIRFNSAAWMKHYNFEPEPKTPSKNEAGRGNEKRIFNIFNPLINQNLGYNLLDYKVFLPVWETRAGLTYSLFNRTAPIVSTISNGQYLALTETLDGKQNYASNFPVPEEEISILVKNMNEVRAYYIEKGFTEVLFSLIPNPVHIVEPDFPYNQLIPKIQESPALKAPVIDIYPVFKKNRTVVFPTNESHWTNRGMQLWIDEVNKQFKKYQYGNGVRETKK